MVVRIRARAVRQAVGALAAVTAMAALAGSEGPLPIALAAPSPNGAAANGGTVQPPVDGGGTVDLPQPPAGTAGGVPTPPAGSPGTSPTVPITGGASLPATVLDAYRKAEAELARTEPGCHLKWQLLAAIGQVESGQARGGQVDASGTTASPILGPVLNGNGFAAIPDTDGGRYDGSAAWDRAVGPMQFIPSTWTVWGTDGNGDGKADPNNIYDAALAAGRYLCASGRDLSVEAQLDQAILGYNHSQDYLRTVKGWLQYFLTGVTTTPDSPFGTGGGSLPSTNPATTGSGASPSPTPRVPSAPSPSPSASPSTPPASPSPTGSAKPSPSASSTTGASSSPSPTPTAGTSASPSPSGSTSVSPSPTPSPTACPSPTADPSGSASPSPSGSTSASPSASPSPSPSASPSPSPSGSDSASPSPSPSGSPTGGCATAAPSASPSADASPGAPATPSTAG